MSKLFVDEIVHQSSQGSGTITLGASGETIALASGASQTMAVNTPAFSAFRTSNQSLSAATTTTIVFNGENYDTESCFDTATGRFTPTTSGKYFLASQLRTNYSGSAPVNEYIQLEKNGTTYAFGAMRGSGHGYGFLYVGGIVEANGTTDYFSISAYGDNVTTYIIDGNASQNFSSFYGYKIIE